MQMREFECVLGTRLPLYGWEIRNVPDHNYHIVFNGLGKMIIRCYQKVYKSSAESVLVRRSIDEWLY